MATRAMISIAMREEGVSFSEEPNQTIVDIYHHWDGYPEGLGVTLASYLDDKKVTFWSELTMGNISSIITHSHHSFMTLSHQDIVWGDKFLINEEEEKTSNS